MAAIKVGDRVPNFSLPSQTGTTVNISDLIGKKSLVIYFYPKDDTPGCTKQAQSFRDSFTEYQNKDVVVLGVSRDDRESHQKFKEKYNLPFKLLVDSDGALTKAYDVDGGGYAKRVTYIIDGNGEISKVDSNVNTSTHATDVLSGIS